jgi:hypothetical protein
VSSRRSEVQLAIRCEEVPIGVSADPSPHLLVSTSRRLRGRTARPRTRFCTADMAVVPASIRGGGQCSRHSHMARTGIEEYELLWVIVADQGQAGDRAGPLTRTAPTWRV